MATVVSSRSGCPFARIDTSGDKPLDCAAWQQETLTFAITERPEVVIIVNRSTGYTRPELGWRTVLDGSGDAALDAQEATARYEQGLDSVVQRLTSEGVEVVLVHNIPELDVLPNVSLLQQWLGTEYTSRVFDGSVSLEQREYAFEAERRVAGRNAGAAVYDPSKHLCDSTACAAVVDGNDVYLDQFHLSRFGSMLLAPSLAASLRAATD